MKIEKIKVFFEIIDFDTNPEKITKYFPEVVNSLEPNKTFILLIAFPPDDSLIKAVCFFIMQLNQKVRNYYFSVKSSMNKIIRQKTEYFDQNYQKCLN